MTEEQIKVDTVDRADEAPLEMLRLRLAVAARMVHQGRYSEADEEYAKAFKIVSGIRKPAKPKPTRISG